MWKTRLLIACFAMLVATAGNVQAGVVHYDEAVSGDSDFSGLPLSTGDYNLFVSIRGPGFHWIAVQLVRVHDHAGGSTYRPRTNLTCHLRHRCTRPSCRWHPPTQEAISVARTRQLRRINGCLRASVHRVWQISDQLLSPRATALRQCFCNR